MTTRKDTAENLLAVRRATDLYQALKEQFDSFTRKLEEERATPYRLSSIRWLLAVFEKFIQARYESDYKMDFAITSGILDRFNRESMVMFNDKQAHIVVDRDSSPHVRFYWLMHEVGHVMSSFEEFELPTTSEKLLILNYAPRQLEQERSCFDFAFKLYDQAFEVLDKEPPTRNYHVLSRDDIWPLVKAYASRKHESRLLIDRSTKYVAEDDQDESLAFQMIKQLTTSITNNIGLLENSLARMEAKLEGM